MSNMYLYNTSLCIYGCVCGCTRDRVWWLWSAALLHLCRTMHTHVYVAVFVLVSGFLGQMLAAALV
jgi:hypothetical protein